MAVLPTDRTVANTPAEHVTDHNELHGGHNLNETHRGRTDNPHAVTKAQVGLANADNTSDANKPVSTATQAALDAKQALSDVALTKIAETVLTGTAASIAFSSIPATYTHLLIEFQGRHNTAITWDNLFLTFNGDTGLNYNDQYVQGTAAVASAAESLGRANIRAGFVTGTTGLANAPGQASIRIANYRRTDFHKTVLSQAVAHDATSAIMRTVAGLWKNTAAITTVTLAPATGNFVAGTVATLFGVGK